MFDAASRYSLTEAPEMAPAVDYITRSSIGPFVDTKTDMRFGEVGRLYLSVETIRELAEGCGLFDDLRAKSDNAYDDGYIQAEIDALKGNDDFGNNIAGLRDELGALLLMLARREPVADAEVPAPDATPAAPAGSNEGDAEPEVFVVDLPAVDPLPEGEHEAVPEPVAAPRQSNGARRDKRPAGVPAGASDGNPFRI